MNLIETLTIIVVVALVVPIITYMTVKLGVFAFFRGRQLFDEKQKRMFRLERRNKNNHVEDN